MRKKINIVWLKRDLRLQDHEPLWYSENSELDYLILYIFEPNLINYGDTSLIHYQFIYESIYKMNMVLKKFNREVITLYGKSIDIFKFILTQFEVKNILTHQETGIKITWERDKLIKRFCTDQKINWLDFETQGVVRGIKNRLDWDKKWYSYVNKNVINNQFSNCQLNINLNKFKLPTKFKTKLIGKSSFLQIAGEEEAFKNLDSFVNERVHLYSKNISSPLNSRNSCSRLSTYLSWGNISIRQVYKYVISFKEKLKNKRSMNAFLARLKWRSHFIQKFESNCNYEKDFINSGYQKIIFNTDEKLLEKWKIGETGYPLVDANMRCLKKTGWINFRMRAMIVSFLCHHLNQDWRNGIYHLSKLFLDYEPGIHYTQFQMQAGITGFNTIRIYNPIKQSIEHDSEGEFIKKWIPELRNLEPINIHSPWKLKSTIFNTDEGLQKYPNPIVEPLIAVKKSRDQLWKLKKNKKVINESKKLIELHVRPRKKKAN